LSSSGGPSHVDGQLDGAVRQLLLGAGVPPASGLNFGLLNGVRLQERIKVLLLAPATAEVVVLDLAGIELTHSPIPPLWQLDAQTSDFTAEQPVRSLDGLRQSETLAGGTDRRCVPDFGLDFNNM